MAPFKPEIVLLDGDVGMNSWTTAISHLSIRVKCVNDPRDPVG